MTRNESDIPHCDLPARMAIFEIQSYLEAIEKNASLHEEKNFDQRIEVIDFIGYQVIDQIEALQRKTAQPDKLIKLRDQAEKLRSDLEEININLFKKIKADIRTGRYTRDKFKNLIHGYVYLNEDDHEPDEQPCYDNLDILINGLSPFQQMPEPARDLEPEMIYYQKTPARIVFELVEKSQFRKDDVFFDLGAGLGQVAILVNLLAGITVKGIEFEPAFCDHARNWAGDLNLSQVTFIHADARAADYSEGNIFFMFTPFRGKMLQEVLALLKKESLRRIIKIITYGPCSTEVALQSWLEFAGPKEVNIYKLCFFTSSSV